MKAFAFDIRSERLGRAFDLMGAYEPAGVLLERSGLGVAGSGEAFRFGFTLSGPGSPEPAELLAATCRALRATDDPGAPPVPVFASLPFDRRRNATVVVPSRVVRRDRDGETWGFDVSREAPGRAEQPARRSFGRSSTPAAPHDAFGRMQLRSRPSPEAYKRAVATAAERVRSGELRKVVLARSLEVTAGRRLDPAHLLWRLRAVDPDCYAFAFPTGSKDRGRVLVGASPELLVSRFGREVRANPLAGSAPRSGDLHEDRSNGERLLASGKDREEHQVVVEAVQDALGPFCDELVMDPAPVLLATASVWHLQTRFRGTLREPAADALTLAAALHPTPAVCGAPREAAARLIRELEPFERDGYAGPVGWFDADGDGAWAIALRCAELRGDVATLFAGAGIVADSYPEEELEETEQKFRAFLESLRWG